uniref:Cadherin domain-containing protein n=1 Tax=Monodelphis domestica TaxID=13616 RepID=A0A5F8G8U7_MONDO
QFISLNFKPRKETDLGLNIRINSNPYFSLRVKDNPDGSKYPEMVVEKSLDREIQSSHHLILTAVDGGDPIRSGTAQIRIRVTDANDNPPVFSQDVYRASVSENLPPGSSVLQVTATDKDEGVNAKITFSFTSIAKDASHKFRLDPTTGEIIIKETLDFEETKVYTMDVKAKDAGSLVAQCKVVLEVRDENDNVPEITLTSLSNPIPEDTVSGTVIALIKTDDRDTGENGEIVCSGRRCSPIRKRKAL